MNTLRRLCELGFGIVAIQAPAEAQMDCATFERMLSRYAYLAKEASGRNLNAANIKQLCDEVEKILIYIKTNIIYTKFNNILDLKFEYADDFSTWQFDNSFDEFMFQFVDGFYYIFVTIDLPLIKNIVKHAPLEMVPFLKEMWIFSRFICSEPEEFGHRNFVWLEGNTAVVKLTKPAIERVMGGLFRSNMFKYDDVYKFSRLTSAFMKNRQRKTAQEIYQWKLPKLVGSNADDKRIAVYFHIPSSVKDSERIEDAMTEISNLFNRMELAKLAHVVRQFDSVLEKRMREGGQSDALNQNMLNLSKFLRCGLTLVSEIEHQPYVLALYVQRYPEDVYILRDELVIFKDIIRTIVGELSNITCAMMHIDDLLNQSEENTHLLSMVFSCGLEDPERFSFQGFLNLPMQERTNRKYLQWRFTMVSALSKVYRAGVSPQNVVR